jgi:hypothetical protein
MSATSSPTHDQQVASFLDVLDERKRWSARHDLLSYVMSSVVFSCTYMARNTAGCLSRIRFVEPLLPNQRWKHGAPEVVLPSCHDLAYNFV